ncbi:hypothetical protein G7Z17_g13539 [Cylindrodendrum hubeiense]|uniref:Uncharacterized protein n=1 Tax=Cylindrodendrum hubeiense TaxID=595255 RepID=A0A9P5GWT9_9HYPO|nr:hypothetical protein G7Z17_g13539 [Cylindrodendrum hubeiense]
MPLNNSTLFAVESSTCDTERMAPTWPGIRWDPREPPPPALRAGFGVHHVANPRIQYQSTGQVQNPQHKLKTQHESEGGGFLHPISASVDVQILQDTAKVTVTQLFVNTNSETIPEAKYTFPLPPGSSVTDFDCRIGSDKILKGMAKPKGEAHDIYKKGRQQNRTTGLLDQHTPEIFTTSIGNIPATASLKARVSFLILLKYDFSSGNGITTFILPFAIACRYGVMPATLQGLLPSKSVLRKLSMQVGILAPEEIIWVKSTSHDTDIQYGAGSTKHQSWAQFAQESTTKDPRAALVTLSDDVTHLEKDFILEIFTRPERGLEYPHAIVETHPSLENHQAIMLTVPPKFMLQNQQTKPQNSEIVFIADRSGSMENNMDALKSAMQFFLKGLPEDTYFNVWSFGSEYQFLWWESRAYSKETLQEALSYVSHHFKPDLGGTDLLAVLNAVVASRGYSDSFDIIVLTDGEVWAQDEIMEYLQMVRTDSNGIARFFSIGIGDVVSHELVEGIARVGGGYAEIIPDASMHSLESKVVAVLNATLTGHIGSIRVKLDQKVLSDEDQTDDIVPGKISQSPADPSTLSPFFRNRIFILLENKLKTGSALKELTVRATTPNGEEVCLTIPIEELRQKGTMVHKLGARALLGDLERQQSQIDIRDTQHDLVRAEGERLGCKWSLVSKWTSFVLVGKLVAADRQRADPFPDMSEPAFERTDQDRLGLLRGRASRGNDIMSLLEASLELELALDDFPDSSNNSGSGDFYIYEDDVYEDDVYEDDVYEDDVYGDDVYEDDVYEDDVYDGPGDRDPDGDSLMDPYTNMQDELPISSHSFSYSNSTDIDPQNPWRPMGTNRSSRRINDSAFGDSYNSISHISSSDLHRSSRPLEFGSWLPPCPSNAPESTNDRTKEGIVRQIIAFQQYNGELTSACAEHKTLIYTVLGDDFKQWMNELSRDIEGLVKTEEERNDVLLTLAIITALQNDFQSCGALWDRLVDKAKTFVHGIVTQDVFDLLISRAAKSLNEHGVLIWPTVDEELTGRRRRVSLDFAPLDEEEV